jgi:hypothetical protein
MTLPQPHQPSPEHVPSSAHLLEEWAQVVRECEAGYEWNVYEYHNDLGVRDALERVVADPDRAHEERTEVATGLAEIDARFQALLQPGVAVGPDEDPWWHRGVPRYAGAELAAELREWFGVEVEVREEE